MCSYVLWWIVKALLKNCWLCVHLETWSRRESGCSNDSITLKFDRRLDNTAVTLQYLSPIFCGFGISRDFKIRRLLTHWIEASGSIDLYDMITTDYSHVRQLVKTFLNRLALENARTLGSSIINCLNSIPFLQVRTAISHYGVLLLIDIIYGEYNGAPL